MNEYTIMRAKEMVAKWRKEADPRMSSGEKFVGGFGCGQSQCADELAWFIVECTNNEELCDGGAA